jgi:hypothetical protein
VLKKLPALATSVLIAAGLIAGPTATGAANADTVSIAKRSGLGWASGVFIPGDSVSAHESFGSWRGAKTDVVVTWPARANWNDVTNSTWLYDRWKNVPQTLVLGLPPFPEQVGASLNGCANGQYNQYWRQFGTTIKAAGISDRTIIRLGWEFNGNWYAWSARNPAEFAACWRQVQTSAESTAPGLRWDWNTNRGPSQLGIDSRNAYPGDAYVDIVGVDSYDGWPGVKSESDWNEHLNGAYGLKFWADFARQHGKRLSIPEWGVYPGTAWAGHNGGDNPLYINKMFGFFKSQMDNLAYEAYFNEPASYYAGALSMNPQAAAEYRKQVGVALTAAPATPAPATPAPTATATTSPTVAPTTSPTAAPTVTVTQTATATVTAPPVTVTRTATATVTAPPVTVTVTAPAATVTAPAATVTAPAATVTAPAATVTVTAQPTAAPTVTVTAKPTAAPTVTVTKTVAPKRPKATKSAKPTASPKAKVKSTPKVKVKVKVKKKKVVAKRNVLTVYRLVALVQAAQAKGKAANAAKVAAVQAKTAELAAATTEAKRA